MLDESKEEQPIPPHYIRPNHGTRTPIHCIFAAHETKRERLTSTTSEAHRGVRWVAISVRRDDCIWTRRKVYVTRVESQIWNFIVGTLDRRRTTWIFALDAGSFLTTSGFWDLMDRGVFQLTDPTQWEVINGKRVSKVKRPYRGCCVVADPPVIISANHADGRIRIVDVNNYFSLNAGWRQNGNVDAPRLRQRAHCSGHKERQCDASLACRVERLIGSALIDWHKSKCGVWQSTVAGLALTSWRHTIRRGDVLVKHGTHTDVLERAAYIAGRCEAFFIGRWGGEYSNEQPIHRAGHEANGTVGNTSVYQLDVRSFYPYLMMQFPYPCKLLSHGPCNDERQIAQRSLCHLPIADVTLETNAAVYPLRKGGRLLWPIGVFRTVLCGPELLQAIEHKHIVSVNSVAWYAPGWPFREWVNKWFTKRIDANSAGDEPREMFCKMILNSLHGKLGSRAPTWVDVADHPAIHRWGNWFEADAQSGSKTEFRAIAGNVQRNLGKRESRDSVPAISAYVSSYGRRALQQIMDQCPERSVLYCDTDSLIVTLAGYCALCNAGLVGGTHLGSLRLIAEAETLEIQNSKQYTIGHKTVSAGRKETAIDVGPHAYSQDVCVRLPTLLSKKPDTTVRVQHVTFRPSQFASPRSVLPSGWTEPLIVCADGDLDYPYASAQTQR
jgi:DNA polymerase type B, organellar and viral